MGLTAKQERFCQEYQIDMNATQAYKRAGYSVHSDAAAGVEGFKLLKNPKITERIKELQDARAERTGITADRVLEELAIIGFARVTDFVKVEDVEVVVPKLGGGADDDEDAEAEEEPETQVYRTVVISKTADIPADKIPAIAGIKQGRSGIELKLNDKVKALELMGKHLGMFTDKIEHSGRINANVTGIKAIIPGEDDDTDG